MTATLNGLRILNTRPPKQAKSLSQRIMHAGGIAIECPTIAIEANPTWINSLPNLNQVKHAIFVSPNAIYHCFEQLKMNQVQWPQHIEIIALGRGSVEALNEFNIQVNYIPAFPDSEHILALNSLQQLNQQTVLLFKGEGGRTVIEEGLMQRGANVVILNVYKRVTPPIRHQFIHSLWRDDLVDIILLTSTESIANLFTLFDQEAHGWLRRKPCLVISERLAKSASLQGIKKIIISHPNQMMQALLDYSQGLAHGQQ